MKTSTLFFCLLQSCLLFPSYCQRFYLTNEQMMMLEQNLNEQKNLLNLQTQELKTLKNQLNESKEELTTLKNQLNNSNVQIEELNSQLQKANESLKKSKSNELKNKIFLSAGVFILGLGVGTYANFRLR